MTTVNISEAQLWRQIRRTESEMHELEKVRVEHWRQLERDRLKSWLAIRIFWLFYLTALGALAWWALVK